MESSYFVPESNIDFDTFRCGFGVCFRERIVQNLQHFLGSTMEISVPKIGDEARSVFFARVSENRSRPVHPMLHGTDPRNMQSILEHGFIIPNGSINGATYGPGVYLRTSMHLGYRCSSVMVRCLSLYVLCFKTSASLHFTTAKSHLIHPFVFPYS